MAIQREVEKQEFDTVIASLLDEPKTQYEGGGNWVLSIYFNDDKDPVAIKAFNISQNQTKYKLIE